MIMDKARRRNGGKFMNRKHVAILLTAAMVASLGLSNTCFAEESEGLSGSFTIFHFFEDDGAGTSKAFWNAANKFMEENPNVDIEFVFTDSNNYQEKLTTLMAVVFFSQNRRGI